MNKSFLTKYKPIFFNDYKIHHNIIKTIDILIQLNSMYILIIGNEGIGKTTILNSIIYEYYKNVDDTIINSNILYINNLKEQGIMYYRTFVKTFCQTSSTIPGKKKTIIIDDIDIIHEQSQQVFRNCLDKYKNNINFIASCTNKRKVIDALQSRVYMIQINGLKFKSLKNLAINIIEKENLDINSKSLKQLIHYSNNSMRTLINYLEKVKILNIPINNTNIHNLCTNISHEIFKKYTTFCLNKDYKHSIKLILNVFNNGYSVMDILDNYFVYVKNSTILTNTQQYDFTKIISKYITLVNTIHENEIELVLLTNNIINII